MPEGDSVVRVAAALTRALAGAEVLGSDFRTPATAGVDLSGCRGLETGTHGKHLFTRFERGGESFCLHTHLGMDGRWRLQDPIAAPGRRLPATDHRIRVVLHTDRGSVIGTELPVLEMLGPRAEADLLARLGPDLLGPDFDPTGLEASLVRAAAHRHDDIGTLLLDQEVVAGLGTVLASETLFLAGISPLRIVAALEPATLRRLYRRARTIAQLSVRTGQRVTTGDRRRGREYWVYGRQGRPCRRCGTPVTRSQVSQHLRSLWWCPACQPPPTP